MANSTKSKADTESVKTAVEQTKSNESVYTAEELAKNCKAFNTSYEIVVIALRKAGKKTASFSEAKKIIETFKNKEVK